MSAFSQLFGIYDLGSGSPLDFDDKDFYNPPIDKFDIKIDDKSAVPNAPTFIPIKNDQANLIFTPRKQCPLLDKRMKKNTMDFYNNNDHYF